MAIEIEAPDGTIVEFPDGTAPDVMKSAMQKKFTPQSKLPGYTRAAAQGATLGWGDEAEAGLRTGFGWLGDYEKTRDQIRKDMKSFGDQNPISSTIAEGAGAILPAALPIIGPALGWGRVAGAAGQGAAAVARAAVPAGLKTGAVYGTGVSTGDLKSLEGANRLGQDTLMHTAIGGVTAPLGSVVGEKIGQWGGRAAGALRNIWNETAGNPQDKAMHAALRGMNQDPAAPGTMLQNLMPTYGQGRNALPQEEVERILTVYGQALGSGEPERRARTIAVHALTSDPNNPIGLGTARRRVNQIVQDYERANQIPLQLHELPATVSDAADGSATNATMRAAALSPNEASGAFRNAVRERQLGLGEDVESIVSTALGGRNGHEALEAAKLRHRNINDGYYGAARQADEAARQAAHMPPQVQHGMPVQPGGAQSIQVGPHQVQPIDLTAELIAEARNYEKLAGPLAEKMRAAVDLFIEPNTQTGQRTLDQFLMQKYALDDMIDGAKTAGNRNLARLLTNFKERIMARARQQNPLFGEANDRAAEGFTVERIADLAKQLSGRAGAKQNEALRALRGRNVPEEARELARIMYAENIANQVINSPRTGNPGKIFNTHAARRTAIEMLGRENGEALIRHADRAALASRTSHHLNGQSQTAGMQETRRGMDIAERVRQLMQYATSPGKVMGGVADFMAQKANRARDAELLRMYGISTERPDLMIDILKRLQGTTLPQDLPPPNMSFPATSGYGTSQGINAGIAGPFMEEVRK